MFIILNYIKIIGEKIHYADRKTINNCHITLLIITCVTLVTNVFKFFFSLYPLPSKKFQRSSLLCHVFSHESFRDR